VSNLAIVEQRPVAMQIKSIDDVSRLSKMFADSGFFDDCRQAAQAGVKIMAAIELGLPVFTGMSGIHVIKGKVTIGANIMAAMVKRSGKYNYRVLEHTEQICKIAFFEAGEQCGMSEFTAADAAKMGTQNMNKFPKNMLFARAISNGIKFYCPDLFLGTPVYTPDELGATMDAEGEIVVEAQVEASPVLIGADQLTRMNALANQNGYDLSDLKAIVTGLGFSKRADITLEVWPEIEAILSQPKEVEAVAVEATA
jgi:hypothetical protein